VVESNSFAAAARSLGLSQSRVSKIISRLEERLGTKLLMRTTRSLSLTTAGAVFYEQARDILSSVENAEQTAKGGQQLLSGRLRINAAAMLATHLVIPAVIAFQEIHKIPS
jgi:DNA-binding transcriptional LysR family regulator